MAWGRTKTPPPPPPPKSTFTSLLPLLILLTLLLFLALLFYQIYLISTSIGSATAKKMEKKNIVLTKDGVTVGVKAVGDEEYKDKTQGVLMKVWDASTWPGYKSRLWNTEGKGKRR